MTQLLVAVGAVANDGTGDTHRAAFIKANTNFTELFSLQSRTINAGDVAYVAGTNEASITLAITAAFNQGKPRVFVPAHMLPYDATLVTFNSAVQMVREGGDWSGNDVLAYGAAGDGIQDDATAFQRAIDDGVTFGGVVNIPAGTYKLGTGLTIDGAVRVKGAGGPSDASGAFGTLAQTTLNFTAASGVAITIVGSAAQGLKNVHLSDFMIVGTANADGGIEVGSGVNVGHCSLKDVTVRSMWKVGSFGFKFRRCLTSIFENLLTVECYDGYLWATGAQTTTLTFINCHAYTSGRHSIHFTQGATWTGSTFIRFIAESSDDAGMYLDGAQFANFYDSYFEDNNRLTGAAPLVILGSGANPSMQVNFYSPYIQNAVGGVCSITLAFADRISFYNPVCDSLAAAGWLTCTSVTTNCVVQSLTSINPTTITNNAPGRVLCDTPMSTWRVTATLAPGGQNSLGGTGFAGVFVITDVTHHRTAIISINGTANTTTILADPDAGFANTPTIGRFVVFWDGGAAVYRFYNQHATDTITAVAVALNMGEIQ